MNLDLNTPMVFQFTEDSDFSYMVSKFNTAMQSKQHSLPIWDYMVLGCDTNDDDPQYFGIVYSPLAWGRKLNCNNQDDFQDAYFVLLDFLSGRTYNESGSWMEEILYKFGNQHINYSPMSLNDLCGAWESRLLNKKITNELHDLNTTTNQQRKM